MKMVFNEKIKHRLVGVLVIISLGVLFAPAIIKKSQLHQQILHVRMSIPKKPEMAQLAIPQKSEVFERVKVAANAQKSVIVTDKESSHVLPIPKSTTKAVVEPIPHLSKLETKMAANSHNHSSIAASPIQQNKVTVFNKKEITLRETEKKRAQADLKHSAALQDSHSTHKQIKREDKHDMTHVAIVNKPKTRSIALKQKPKIESHASVKKLVINRLNQQKKSGYSIQLAYFTNESNAKSLLNQLKKKGYPAHIDVVKNKQRVFFKVVVGPASDRHQIEVIQKKLADAVNLKGYIIKNGVS